MRDPVARSCGDPRHEPRHHGAKLGMTMVLHTWQTLQHHPHVRCLVPGGGPSVDGTRWVA
jgi:hypothetical protein